MHGRGERISLRRERARDDPVVLGVLSDTHGLLRAEVLDALRGVDAIVHAGDVGAFGILERLGELAPTHAVRGNVDVEPWARELPVVRTLEVVGSRLHVLHDRADLALEPATDRIDVVIFGHTHRPIVEEESGVIYLNPGSAGPRRFKLPVTLALLRIRSEEHPRGRGIEAELVELTV